AESAFSSHCTITEESPEHVSLHVDTTEPVVTVLADSFAPGWHAQLDGIDWPIMQVNGLFRGVATPAGVHDIDFTYRPAGFPTGMTSALGLLVLLVFVSLVRLVRRR
ncbi:MAG TPA: hypothetical protein ENN80_09925, partial [Candidatus Hydrogenedentes bacterium]|nr:hypothetical protein [Candidatus Hydrogenedentota bacterium]